MNLDVNDKNDVLKKAEELLKDNQENCADTELNNMPIHHGSYDNENDDYEEDKGFLEESDDEVNEKKLGYRREPRYKPPSFLKIGLAMFLIVLLGILIGLMLPYIPPVLV